MRSLVVEQRHRSTSQGRLFCSSSSPEHASLRKASRSRMQRRSAGYLFAAPYVLLLVAVGIYPVGYALDLAFTSFAGHFTGLANFTGSFDNPFFVPAVE